MSEQFTTPPGPMNVEQFYAWVDQQPKGRYELNRGEVIAMAPELIGDARAKLAAVIALRDAIKAAGLPCEAFVDGVGLRVSDDTVYIPDASVNCGGVVANENRHLPEPIIVVEVTSPSTARFDTFDKLNDYFLMPSIQHYIQINMKRQAVFHHRRQDDGRILSALIRAGSLTLDPPGLTLRIENLLNA